MLHDTCLLLFTPVNRVQTVACPRTVRNFRRAASLFPWCIKSARFNGEGFSTMVALEHFQGLPAPSYQKICAQLISTASRSHTPGNIIIANLRESLNSIEFWEDLNLPPHPTNDMVLGCLAEIETFAVKDQKPSSGKHWLVEAIIKYDQGISDTRLIELYNRLLYPAAKSSNNKKVRALLKNNST